MRRGPRSVVEVASLALMAYLLLCWVSQATTEIDPFDGAQNTLVARNLAFRGAWAFRNYDRWEVWSAETTTGPTVLLPIAAAYRLMGDRPFLPNVVCALLCGALVFAAWGLARRTFATGLAAAGFLTTVGLMATTTVKPFLQFYRPLGEVPAGLLVLIGTLLAVDGEGQGRHARARMWLSGVAVGLAVCAKLVAALPAAALGATLALLPGLRPTRLGALARWGGGLVLVLLATEFFRLVQLGSWAAYAQNWREALRFLSVQGSGLGRGPVGLQVPSVWARLQTLGEHLGWFALPLGGALLAWPRVAYAGVRPAAGAALRIATVLGFAVVVMLGWWLFLSDRGWVRHALIALLLLPFYAHFASAGLFAPAGRAGRAAWVAWLGVLLACLCLSPPTVTTRPHPAWTVAPRTIALFDTAAAIRRIELEHPAARFWAAGHWRNFDLQTQVDVQWWNLLASAHRLHLRFDGDDFLVTSEVFNWERNPLTTAIASANARNVAHQAAPFSIYRLTQWPGRPGR
ncbi:MAG: hypothetical protein U0807_08640 [Candidatus Binatia bacterium]